MTNKVLVKIITPELDYSFDVFLPVNEIIWKEIKLLVKSISDLTGGALDTNKEFILMNKKTNKIYDNNQILINTDIRNATELILLSVKK